MPFVSILSSARFRAPLGTSRRVVVALAGAALLAAGALLPSTPEPASVERAAPVAAPVLLVSHVGPPAVDTVEVTPVSSPEAEAAALFLGEGRASYYGRELSGRRTASGERFDPTDFTAAHRTLPFGTHVRVTNLRNAKSVVVRVNDRGPFHRSRVIDISRAAADAIGMTRAGTATVRLERVGGGARG